MPPRKGKGIVTSGNAGNSSKAAKAPLAALPSTSPEEKPLFPPGFKYPLSLLNERCHLKGWDKPIVDARMQGNGWVFVVTLTKMNKKNSQKERVRLEPHPPYISPSALEARHWGATYALYRFCNNIQLNLVLPPEPRKYWAELESEHKNCPEHLKWMYDPDPFSARREVDERQAKAVKRRQDANPENKEQQHQSSTSVGGRQDPEVKMEASLRQFVEDAVKSAFSLYPEAADLTDSEISEEEISNVSTKLCNLGFTAVQAGKSTQFLSEPSPFANSLLRSLSLLDACIEYLVLHVPECDLPPRFVPSVNHSVPFVSSAHSGFDDLKTRWIKERAVKEAGWPAHTVSECASQDRLMESWELLIAALGKKLMGEELPPTPSFDDATSFHPVIIDEDEVAALGAQYENPVHINMPLFSAPIQLHILLSANNLYPYTVYPPMYITSSSVPAYIRLHLLSRLLHAMKSKDFLQPGEGLCMAAMRILEEEWGMIEAGGPPDMSTVLQHLVPQPATSLPSVDVEAIPAPRKGQVEKKPRNRQANKATDVQIKDAFEKMCRENKYQDILAARKRLPAYSAQQNFLHILQTNRVVVVIGETGCGKTTQLPQFILDSLILANRGSQASIVVTQPRRISALSVAARVSAERLDDGSVAYAIRGDSNRDHRTRLLFCTTGIVLRRIASGDKLEQTSHIIVDEVHERSMDGDFLLLELKELLKTHPTLKVVLMSATINHEDFIRYFDGAPLLQIPGFTHPVTDLYLEDIIPITSYRPTSFRSIKKESEEEKKAFRDELKSSGLDDESTYAIESVYRSDRIDYQLIAAIVHHITSTASKKGGILIFLSGVQEIQQCVDAVLGVPGASRMDIFPLHANLTSEDQRKVFATTSNWKIIAATNVAETSITIDDVIYVIDAGKVKETRFDPETSLSRLVENWVTLAAAKQRRGRAGRTQPGFCYKLYTRYQEKQMEAFPTPEILRVPLESISLSVKVQRENEDVKLFLQRAISPPETAAMEKAWSALEELGAVNEQGALTALGRHMSLLPIDLRLAKMLILGAVFQCLDPILTIAACLSSKPLFVSPMDKREEANKARARFSTGNSDLITNLNAYNDFIRLRSSGKPQKVLKSFCDDNFISTSAIREIGTLRQEFFSTLSTLGFIPPSSTPTSASINTNSTEHSLIKGIILGGLYPRLAHVTLPTRAVKFDKVSAGTVQRENAAREFQIREVRNNERVFLHPASVLFGQAVWKSPFLVYFQKQMTSKIFLRDATQVPLYAILLFGGTVSVNHVAGGLTVGGKEGKIRLRALPRIGILVNQLRRLLDIQLQRCVEEGSILNVGQENPVVNAMLALLAGDGMPAM